MKIKLEARMPELDCVCDDITGVILVDKVVFAYCKGWLCTTGPVCDDLRRTLKKLNVQDWRHATLIETWRKENGEVWGRLVGGVNQDLNLRPSAGW